MKSYPENSFTVASADNLDYLHSYARVYCGEQKSSWHGTTVQVLQPQPLSLTDFPANSTPVKESNTEGHSRYDAVLSKRLCSTLTPVNSPSSGASSQKRQCIYQNSLTLADFNLSRADIDALNELRHMSVNTKKRLLLCTTLL
jgi:hypothetical protein